MAGLLLPKPAYDLVKAIKEEVNVPIEVHSHYTSGVASMTYLKAIEAGADIIDTDMSPLSMGTAQPATEVMVAALQGTDYEISIICKIKAIIETEGTIVLPGKYLYEVVRTLPGEYVEIKNNDSDNSVNIRSNSAQFNLLNMQENEFPIIEPLKGQINFNLKNDIFLNFIKKTSFACATDESRPVFTGCLMDITDENIVMAATNMHRLALIKENINYISDNNIKIIIPAKILNEFTHIFNSEIPTDIQISCTHNKISFSYENIYVISRLIEGQFPDYNRVIPKEFKTHVNINKNEFQSALDRVSLISRSGDYNIIHFEFVDNIVRISSDNPNIGKAEETINVDIEGPGINISFNAKYIIDVLKAIDAENFIFSFNQPLTTASITQRDNKNFVYVVTPVRTKTM